MAKPDKPQWAFADPSYVIEPDLAKKQVGWTAGEKPPNQHMNWIHFQTEEWINYFESKGESDAPTMLRCSAALTWSGSALTFSQPIKISFRVSEGEQINQIPNADSPIAMNDGDVLVLYKDKENASPVSLAIAASYAALDAGQYVVVAESSLSADNAENETVIFRRSGSNLEVVPTGMIYASGDIFTLGKSSASSSPYIPPIGSIIPFYDFNGALTFNSTVWKYCDGTAGVTIGGIGAQTLPDLSNRYLVGFGTDGGGDIDSAAWATAVVGAASHQVDLSHAHTSAAHVHTSAAHTHGVGSFQFQVANYVHPAELHMYESDGSSRQISDHSQESFVAGGVVKYMAFGVTSYTFYTKNGAGTSGSTTPGDTGSTTPGATGTSGSAAQSIQPRSIRVRFIMRVN